MAVAYWLIDAIANLEIDLDIRTWKRIANWASPTFSRDFSLVAANHDALMDPVSLAMGACLVARLRRIAESPSFKDGESLTKLLPTSVELWHALKIFWSFQGRSGIWPKYFPIFHYPEAGANFCFTFEVLEAVMHEFSDSSHLKGDDFLTGIESAVSWCEANRLQFPFGGKMYNGWNSGGVRRSLESGKPEVWATAAVYVFHYRLIELVDSMIDAEVLKRFSAQRPVNGSVKEKEKKWADLLDMELTLQGDDATTVKRVIFEHIIVPAKAGTLKTRRSALLFGPPGTSKTSIVRAVAQLLGWPYIEITPSHFLSEGLEKIYLRADEVFADLMDLEKVVVLFDEMDALVQSRGGQLDVTRQFLTTSMLPKLAELHQKESVIFFMATNHQHEFDPAIKRPGRFDLLLCMGPPTWEEKMNRISIFWPETGQVIRERMEVRPENFIELDIL